MNDKRQQLAYLVFRLLLAPIFIAAGLKHLVAPGRIVARLESAPFAALATAIAPAHLLVVSTGVVLFAGGLALLLGFQTRLAALGLAAVLIPITLTVQVGSAEGSGPLFKNIALFGALVQFAAAGAGRYSLDARIGWGVRRAAFVALGGLAVLLTPPANAAESKAEAKLAAREKVAFLVQAPKPLKVVLQTSQTMLEGKEFPASAVTVVVCGEAVGAIIAGGEHEPLVREVMQAGVRVTACGLTLKEKAIPPETLATGVAVVPNGLVEILRLQALGFRTLEL